MVELTLTEQSCPRGHGPWRFLCLEPAERALGAAWDQFGSAYSKMSFPASKQAEAAALVRQAHVIAHALIVTSMAKTYPAHHAARVRARRATQQFWYSRYYRDLV